MINDLELRGLKANQRFLALELRRRGIEVNVFDWDKEILEACNGHKTEYFCDICSSIMPLAQSNIASSKTLTKVLLSKQGLSVPRGYHCAANEIAEALKFAEEIGYPIVIKPAFGVQGELVHTDIEDSSEVEFALLNILQERGEVEILIEEQFVAKEYRIFFTTNGDYAILHRDPAHVIGDGKSNITQLAAAETQRRMNPRINCLCPVAIDLEVLRFLRKKNLSLEYVPAKDEKIYLRSSSNVMMGGVCEDFTDRAHPSVLKIAARALAAIPGLPYAGIDFMTNDIQAEQTPSSYRILELNSVPGIGMHVNPAIGESKNVPGMIIDMIF